MNDNNNGIPPVPGGLGPNVSGALDNVHTTARKMWRWSTDADMTALDVSLAVCRALTSEIPLWVVIIAPPSSGKTEMLTCIQNAMPRLSFAFDKLTPAAFISGAVGKDGEVTDLLPLLDGRLVLLKDLSPLLTMDAAGRDAIVGDLRSIYDGSYTKVFAKRGVVTYNVTFPILAACTPAWENYYSVLGVLGQRFLTARFPDVPADLPNERVTSRAELRGQMTDAIATYLKVAGPPNALGESDDKLIFDAAMRLSILRGSVPRDGGKTIIGEPVVEAPYRVYRQLRVIASCSSTRVAINVAEHGVPRIRKRTLDALANGENTTDGVAEYTKMSRTVTERCIEDFVMLGLATEDSRNRPYRYHLTKVARGARGESPPVRGG